MNDELTGGTAGVNLTVLGSVELLQVYPKIKGYMKTMMVNPDTGEVVKCRSENIEVAG